MDEAGAQGIADKGAREVTTRGCCPPSGLLLSAGARRRQRFFHFLGQGFLFGVASVSAIAVFFIFIFIVRDALPFCTWARLRDFFTSTRWYPSGSPPEFGALAIMYGSMMVTVGAVVVAVPLGIAAAVCLSDVLPFSLRQVVKPVIEILAAIPSVAYGFFALVVFAPLLQDHGGRVLAILVWLFGVPVGALAVLVASDMLSRRLTSGGERRGQGLIAAALATVVVIALVWLSRRAATIQIDSGTNALNVSLILGIMALPTIVSVSEDALQAAGSELREGSYALGATRAETILNVVIPAASGGISAAIILGFMRAIGETMVVWMASGNAAQLPRPLYNYLMPVRTLTATIAGDMGEADHVTGSERYHVLFVMALVLLLISFACNSFSEWIIWRRRKRLGV
ncbi:MAG: phosphate ABC transporter permease subunit PstC [bacterium]|nr:phosphate ABC transporter permease subunit PstC [bacterium]